MTIEEMAARVSVQLKKAKAELEFHESCVRVRVGLLEQLNTDMLALARAQGIEERFLQQDDDGGPLYPPETPEARISIT